MLNIKTISTVLLSKDGYYIGINGELPKRFNGDKDFIINLIKNKTVLMSKNTYNSMPKSILDKAKEIIFSGKNYDINFGIGTFEINSDMFIIIISNENLNGGKKFKFDLINKNYDHIMNINGINIFFRKKYARK